MVIIDRTTAVWFDLDDTLYCEHDYVRSGFKAVAEFLGDFGHLDPAVLYREMTDEWRKNGRGKIFDRIINAHALSIAPDLLVRVYREHEPQLSLYPDADNFLALLASRSIPTGIITDGDKGVQWRKIEALGIRCRLQAIIVTDELGRECWKPSAVPYRRAMESLQGNVRSFIYIGDNPHKDFCTAKALGFHTIRIIRETGDHMETRLAPDFEADETITTLEELVPLIT